jgi:molybdopterin-guanine dinucleotide biosynthesis protein A
MKPDHGAADVTGVILAGGRGTRMGGADKGLVPLAGRPMVERVLDALRPQVDRVLINANRHLDAYGKFGCPVIPDAIEDYPGPLAGMAAGLAAADTERMLFVPCDTPLLPPDLCRRMLAAARAREAEIAIASDGRRSHPVFALIDRALAASLEAFLAGDERKILRWMNRHRLIEVDFSDCPQRFVNVNTAEELAALEQAAGEQAAGRSG